MNATHRGCEACDAEGCDKCRTVTVEIIRELLRTNDRAVVRAIWVLYERQTPTERASRETIDANGEGFNAYDANFLTSLARQADERGTLSPKQIAAGRRAVMKYAGQLANIANAA